MTDDQIVGLLIGLLFAGQHTSSITSAWTALFLMHNDECMRQVLKEQDDVVDSTVTLDADMVSHMKYLQSL